MTLLFIEIVLLITMGLTTVAMSNVIVLSGHASAIAWRNEPGPLSALVVTTGFEMHAAPSIAKLPG
ncbi:MAG TPA: hypothetical protein VM940_02510 [Chthoniobacterales bacterium]|nr:hypothetical protein [Chthoniobacterales bacterium]